MYRLPEDGKLLPKHVVVNKELCCGLCSRCVQMFFAKQQCNHAARYYESYNTEGAFEFPHFGT
jgi:hypothetical protein